MLGFTLRLPSNKINAASRTAAPIHGINNLNMCRVQVCPEQPQKLGLCLRDQLKIVSDIINVQLFYSLDTSTNL